MAKSVLHVEDEPDIRELTSLFLGMEGDFEYFEAANGLQALEMTRSWMPDVAILDYMMPELNGLQVLEAWRERFSSLQLPVIILSAVPEAQLGKLKTLGVYSVIRKPFDGDNLVSAVRKALETKTGA